MRQKCNIKLIYLILQLNENEQRRNVAAMASYGNGLQYLQGTAFWGFVTVVLMNRAAAGVWFDSTPLTKRPARAFLWFLTGASIAAICNVTRFKDAGYDRKSYQLHQRVAQNEHTHAILRNLRYHLQTRKMSVWDASPQ